MEDAKASPSPKRKTLADPEEPYSKCAKIIDVDWDETTNSTWNNALVTQALRSIPVVMLVPMMTRCVGVKKYVEAMRPHGALFQGLDAEKLHSVLCTSPAYREHCDVKLGALLAAMTTDERALLEKCLEVSQTERMLNVERYTGGLFWVGKHSFGQMFKPFGPTAMTRFCLHPLQPMPMDQIRAWFMKRTKATEVPAFSVLVTKDKIGAVVQSLPKETQDEWRLVQMCADWTWETKTADAANTIITPQVSTCCACLSNSSCMAMSKCMHLCLCKECAAQVNNKCPKCRTEGVPKLVYL